MSFESVAVMDDGYLCFVCRLCYPLLPKPVSFTVLTADRSHVETADQCDRIKI